ncbi:MAG TPA: hypothetical protein VLB32_01765 [Candidatus Acidoferrales bacterium]|nr:hypothetical protein [Candidatus Acidoferrales bacterium]
MEVYLTIFIGLTTVALVAQATALVLAYVRLAKLDEETKATRQQLREQLGPILRNVEDTSITVRENSRVIFDDLSAMSYTARKQVDKFDRISDELADRLRLQIIRVDELLTVTLDNLEHAGTAVRENVIGPVKEAAAVIQGVKAAIDFINSRRRERRPAGRSEEDLFI